ncbi:hypothetical protein ACLMJK_009226 [Lecanora helva]
MDLPIQHDYTLARLWNYLNDKPSENAPKSSWQEQGLKGLCRFFYADTKINQEDSQTASTHELNEVNAVITLADSLRDDQRNDERNCPGLDNVNEERLKSVSIEHEATHKAEIETLKRVHQEQIEHLKQAHAIELEKSENGAQEKEQEQVRLARELTEKTKAIAKKNEIIANGKTFIREVKMAAECHHARFCANGDCKERMKELYNSEIQIREQYHNVVHYNDDLQRSVRTSNDQIAKAEQEIAKLKSELYNKDAALKEARTMLQANDAEESRSTFANILRDYSNDMTEVKSQLVTRLQEIQNMYADIDRFQVQMDNANAETQEAVNIAEQLRDELTDSRMQAFELNTQKMSLEAENTSLRQEMEHLQQENAGLAANNAAKNAMINRMKSEVQEIKASVMPKRAHHLNTTTASTQQFSQFRELGGTEGSNNSDKETISTNTNGIGRSLADPNGRISASSDSAEEQTPRERITPATNASDFESKA